MTDPLVSINCITYNHAPYIRQCLDGFLMQKRDFAIEVLIHDDASTDGTVDIIKHYEKKYPDIIKPIYQIENQFSKGVAISRTYNFPRIKGHYIAICQGDDYWTDDCFLKDGIAFLEKSEEYNCYATNTIYKSSDFEKTALEVQNKQYEHIGHDISFDNYIYLHTSARIYRNNLIFSDLLKYPYTYKGEIYFWWTFLSKGKVFFDHKITSVYNITGKGVYTRLSQKEQKRRMFICCMKATKLFNNKYSIFFWEILPKNNIHKKIEKILGIEKTMKFLQFCSYHPCPVKRRCSGLI